MKRNDKRKRSNAIVHKAALYSPPSMAPPISAEIAVVNVLAGKKSDVGKTFIWPMTMATAKASPKARARPKIIPVKIPPFAAGKTTLAIVSHRVAPNP